jgi:hypothetical protein
MDFIFLKLWFNITINNGQRQEDNFRVEFGGLLLWLGVTVTPYKLS